MNYYDDTFRYNGIPGVSAVCILLEMHISLCSRVGYKVDIL
jgi:hypothetical protein